MKLFNLQVSGEVLSSKYESHKLVFFIRLTNHSLPIQRAQLSRIKLPLKPKTKLSISMSCELNWEFPRMSAEKFLKKFPFHVVLNNRMEIESVGKCILGVKNDEGCRSFLGRQFEEVFVIKKRFQSQRLTWIEVILRF